MAKEQEKAPNGKISEEVKETTPKVGKFKALLMKLKRFFKIIFFILLCLSLIIGGFFLGVYLKFFDMNEINVQLELYKYPVLNEYFVEPDAIEREIENISAAITPDKEKESAVVPKKEAVVTPAPAEAKKTPTLTVEEIEKQLKQRQAEEKKRITKLARLYGQMKPAEAAEILNGLNDEMVIEILGKMDEAQVSKILVAFNRERSTRLTREMYNGKPPVSQARQL